MRPARRNCWSSNQRGLPDVFLSSSMLIRSSRRSIIFCCSRKRWCMPDPMPEAAKRNAMPMGRTKVASSLAAAVSQKNIPIGITKETSPHAAPRSQSRQSRSHHQRASRFLSASRALTCRARSSSRKLVMWWSRNRTLPSIAAGRAKTEQWFPRVLRLPSRFSIRSRIGAFACAGPNTRIDFFSAVCCLIGIPPCLPN